jgi:hypothetical protein
MAKAETKTKAGLHGKDLKHARLAEGGYDVHEDYKKQGDDRVVKHLRFPYTVAVPNPMMPDGESIIQEREALQNEKVTAEQIGLLNLERGDRLGSFYTDADLAARKRGQEIPEVQAAEAGAAELPPGPDFSEMGEHEIAEYIEQNQLNVGDTVALAGDDPETAKRVLEAETILAESRKDEPRKGVVDGLAAIVERSNQ